MVDPQHDAKNDLSQRAAATGMSEAAYAMYDAALQEGADLFQSASPDAGQQLNNKLDTTMAIFLAKEGDVRSLAVQALLHTESDERLAAIQSLAGHVAADTAGADIVHTLKLAAEDQEQSVRTAADELLSELAGKGIKVDIDPHSPSAILANYLEYFDSTVLPADSLGEVIIDQSLSAPIGFERPLLFNLDRGGYQIEVPANPEFIGPEIRRLRLVPRVLGQMGVFPVGNETAGIMPFGSSPQFGAGKSHLYLINQPSDTTVMIDIYDADETRNALAFALGRDSSGTGAAAKKPKDLLAKVREELREKEDGMTVQQYLDGAAIKPGTEALINQHLCNGEYGVARYKIEQFGKRLGGFALTTTVANDGLVVDGLDLSPDLDTLIDLTKFRGAIEAWLLPIAESNRLLALSPDGPQPNLTNRALLAESLQMEPLASVGYTDKPGGLAQPVIKLPTPDPDKEE